MATRTFLLEVRAMRERARRARRGQDGHRGCVDAQPLNRLVCSWSLRGWRRRGVFGRFFLAFALAANAVPTVVNQSPVRLPIVRRMNLTGTTLVKNEPEDWTSSQRSKLRDVRRCLTTCALINSRLLVPVLDGVVEVGLDNRPEGVRDVGRVVAAQKGVSERDERQSAERGAV